MILSLSFICGVSYFFVGIAFFQNDEKHDSFLMCSARVENCVNIGANFQTLIIDDVKFDGVKSSRNVLLNISGGQKEFKTGDIIEFSGKFNSLNLFEFEKFNSYYYKNNLLYNCEIMSENIKIVDNYLKINEKIKINIKNFIFDNFYPDSAKIAYAAIFGEKIDFSKDLNENFKSTNLVHLLAVSGMHIGMIVLLLLFVLKKLKLNKYIRFVIVCAALIFFCFICDFSPSVLRASLMSIFLLTAKLISKRPDNLTVLGLAMLAILIFSPLMLFDIGFQLSFVCVFAIILFSTPIAGFVNRAIKNKTISSMIGTIIAVQISIFPLVLMISKSYSIFSPLLNFICIPLFEVAFVINLICMSIVAIMPFLSFIFFVPDMLFRLIIIIISFFATIPNSIIYLDFYDKYFACVLMFLLFFVSRFFQANAKVKLLTISIFAIVLFSSNLILSNSTALGACSIANLKVFDKSVLVFLDEKREAVILDFDNARLKGKEKIDEGLNYFKINGNKTFVDVSETSLDELEKGNIKIKFIALINKVSVLEVDFNNFKILIVSNPLTANEKQNLNFLYDGQVFDLIYDYGDNDVEIESQIKLSNNSFNNNQSIKHKGNFTIDMKNDKIGLIRSID
ncbi:MAG: ComEC/Rec2 family competence protein [Clostridia bacterium]